MHRDEDYWSKKNFDDWITRREGTMMGGEAKRYDRIFQPTASGGATPGSGTVGRRSKSSGEPWFPGVDDWFDRKLPVETRGRIGFVLMVIGAIAGVALAPGLGLSGGVAALIGAVGGLVAIPLLILSVKLFLFCLILGVVGFVAYFLYLIAFA